MSGSDMANFMAQYSGKFSFIVKVSHDSAGEIHITAGEGKGIDNRRIKDSEGVIQLVSVRDLRHLLAFLVNKSLQRFIFIQAVSCYNLWISFLTHGYFLFLGH